MNEPAVESGGDNEEDDESGEEEEYEEGVPGFRWFKAQVVSHKRDDPLGGLGLGRWRETTEQDSERGRRAKFHNVPRVR